MDWIGTWENQYGSRLVVTGQTERALEGFFRTALADSAFFSKDLPISALHCGDCVVFSMGLDGEPGATVCSFAGTFRDDRLETMWLVVSGARAWPHAVATNADTFRRTTAH